MDQFSHDLTLALEETSLMDRACGVGRWGSRRRTRSTGNLPCAPQPTEDSSSSPTDTLNISGPSHGHSHHANPNAKMDGLESQTYSLLPASDSDDKGEPMLPLRLPGKAVAAVRMGIGALESDSLNETTFSPARFYKPNSRRKRKIKRMSMEFEFSKDSQQPTGSPHSFTESPLQPGMLSSNPTACAYNTGTIRKRLLKTDAARSNLFFCGKRKRSNRDRYHEHEQAAGCAAQGGCSGKLHSSSMPRYTHMEDSRMRPRSYSSTSKPPSDRLLPLNKGLLSKIDRMAQTQTQEAQKTDNTSNMEEEQQELELPQNKQATTAATAATAAAKQSGDFSMDTVVPVNDIASLIHPPLKTPAQQQQPLDCCSGADYQAHRKKSQNMRMMKAQRRRRFCQTPQSLEMSMDCSDLCDFLSSSSLSSSSDSEDEHRRHDTDREGDDELTDWPGNEFATISKYDPKRKLTKKSLLPQIRSDEIIGEDDTLMSGTEANEFLGACQSPDALQDLSRFQPTACSEPIEICGAGSGARRGFFDANTSPDKPNGVPVVRQIESEMSGETSNPFLSSSPPQKLQEVREIRAGCRRINGDRPGFSIKLSVNERLARFLQDARQTQIRLPDIEIYEHDSLLNLATLYSLNMVVEHGCTVLTKTRNTTQSVNIDPQGNLEQRQNVFGDFKRRCYGDGNITAPEAAAASAASSAANELIPEK
ncbi:CG4281 [Drosophila busckii]|uniref:CG4281 n=1 Tax=Drosophila busckii TaxID=30019 RepID=A0A0M5J6A0_DROBS|nr:uncharacterized protein LOC108606724 isoform X2 [Drosophila busckii]ALC49406.1 CG4281 [Drosophila busckii]